MIRQFGPWIGELIGRRHVDEGVRLRTGVGVEELTGDGAGRVAGCGSPTAPTSPPTWCWWRSAPNRPPTG
ncbi:hypothetical protein NKH77_11330 [Streptomyces sp. M19]